MEKYCGNARPFLYVLFGEQDKAEAEKIMNALAENGHSLWCAGNFTKKEEKRLKKAAALLVVISPAFAGSQDLKKAVGQASLANMPIISVYLEETKLSPGLSMLLGTTQGVFRPNFDSDEEMLKKLCAAPVLKNLSVTEGQKAAAKRTTALIALASIAAVAAIALTALNVFREVVPIDPNSDLARLGVSGNALDIEEFYLYGETVEKDYHLSQLVYPANAPAVLYLENSSDPLPSGQLSSLQDFSQLINLEALCLAGNPITDVSPLANLTNLRLLDLSGGESMHETDLTPLASLPDLETLNLAFSNVRDLSPLENCPSLRTLYLSYNGEWLLDNVTLPEVEVIFLDGKAEDFASLQAACEDPQVRSIYICAPITIPEGETVTVRNGVSLRADIDAGQFTNNGELLINGYFELMRVSFLNTGTIRIGNNGQLLPVEGEFDNRGSLYVDSIGFFNTSRNNIYRQTGTLENNGNLSVSFGAKMYVDGGRFDNRWGVYVHDQGEFHWTGGSLTNEDASFRIAPSGYFMGDFRSITGNGELIFEIDPESTLNQFGLTGNAMDYTSFYLYGNTIQENYSRCQLVDGAHTGAMLIREDTKEQIHIANHAEGKAQRTGGNLSDISDFSRLVNVEELCLAGNQIEDFSPLADLQYLRILDLSLNSLDHTDDLTPLAKLPNLEVLNLAYSGIQNFAPLRNCPSLKTLYLSYWDQGAIERTPLPGVEIIYVDALATDFESLKAATEDPSIFCIQVVGNITVPKDEKLTIYKDTYVVAYGPCAFINNGEVNLNGTIETNFSFENHGSFQVNPSGWLNLCNARFDNRGELYLAAAQAVLSNHQGSVFQQNKGSLRNYGHMDIMWNGEFQFNGGVLENYGEIYVQPDGRFVGDEMAVTGPRGIEHVS